MKRNDIGANAVPAPRHSASPSHVSLSRPYGRVSLSRVAPTFVCRTHKAPVPFGHRQWLTIKRGER